MPLHPASEDVHENATGHHHCLQPLPCARPPPRPYLKVCPISQHQLQPYSQHSNRSGLKQKSDPALPLLRTARPLRGREVCELTCLNCPMRPRPHPLPPPRAPATLASRMPPTTMPPSLRIHALAISSFGKSFPADVHMAYSLSSFRSSVSLLLPF